MMMHPDSKMITFMCGENIGCPLMLVCMSECSDMPLACVMMDMGSCNPCMEFRVICDPNMGMMVMPMPTGPMTSMGGGCAVPMPMPMPMSSMMPMSMMGSCMPMGGMGGCGNGMNGMGMGMMSPMMCMNMSMMCSGGSMMDCMGGMRMIQIMGRQDMMRVSKMVLLKLDSMSGCMDMNRADMMSHAMKMAQPLWHCMFAHMHMHTSVMICRNPMTHDITAHEKGMMMGGGECRMGMLGVMMPFMMPMRCKL